MIFNLKDIETFQAQKDFIDTVFVPLLHLEFSEKSVKNSGSATDFLLTLTNFIESQFRGRVMLLPPITYLQQMDKDELLCTFQQELQQFGFKHVVFITCDHHWTTFKEQHQILWLPAIPLESMDQMVKHKVMEEQLKQIIPYLTSLWSNKQMANL